MPRHHGLELHGGSDPAPDRSPVCVLGISQVVRMIGHGKFHMGNETSLGNVLKLCSHWHDVTLKLLYSLHMFQQEMIQTESAYNVPESSGFGICGGQVRASVAADSVFSYLAIFADDIADVVLYAYGKVPTKDLDSFVKVKKWIEKQSDVKYLAIGLVFKELEQGENWYTLAMKRISGVRQRLTHYEDTIEFSGTRNCEDEAWSLTAFLCGPVGSGLPRLKSELVSIIKDIFLSLFGWLDQVYEVTTTEMKSQNTLDDSDWQRELHHTRFSVLHCLPTESCTYPDEYMYLPLLVE